MRTKVFLHGEIGDSVGQSEWEFELDRPVEALQAVDANTDGKLLEYLQGNYSKFYRVVLNNNDVQDVGELVMIHRGLQEVHVLPVIHGSGRSGIGMGMLIAGLLLTLVTFGGAGSLLVAGAGALAGGGAAGAAAASAMFAAQGFLSIAGLALAAMGMASLMAPEDQKDQEKPENMPSYIFNGAVNTYRQGNPIPVGFGYFKVGSQVISAGVKAVDLLPMPGIWQYNLDQLR